MSRWPDELWGASPYKVAKLAGLPLSLPQTVVLKCLGPERLNRDETSEFRFLTGTLLGNRPENTREVWIEKGRRSGFSTFIAAPFAVSCLFRTDLDRVLAPGEVPLVGVSGPHLSHAEIVLDAIAGLLDLFGGAGSAVRTQGRITLAGVRAVVQSLVADHLGVVGRSLLGDIVDESAKLPFEDGADGQDIEVFASLRPALATTDGKLLVGSSPWTRRGVHYETCRELRGKISPRLAFKAPTWRWNPTLTEERTRELEPDERRWRREFAGDAEDPEAAFLRAHDVRACVDAGVRERAPQPNVQYFAALDVGLRRDRSALVITHRELRKQENGPPLDMIVVDVVRVWSPQDGRPLDPNVLMQEVASTLRRYKISRLFRDSFAGDFVASALAVLGIRSKGPTSARGEEVSMSTADQAARFGILASRVATHTLALLDHAATVRELIDLQLKLRQSGRVAVEAPGKRGAHDDIADALAIAVEQAASGIPGGGDIVPRMRVSNVAGDIQVRQEWLERRRGIDGITRYVPTEPPRGTPAHAARMRELWAQGCFDTAGEVERFARESGLPLPWDSPPSGINKKVQ